MPQTVISVQLREIRVEFDLPRQIGKIATLRQLPAAEANAPTSQGCILDVQGIPENQAVPTALSVLSAIRLASQCSVRIARYVFPDGKTMDAFDAEDLVWGHYDPTLSADAINWVENYLSDVSPFTIVETFSRMGNAMRLHSAALRTHNADLALLGFVGAIESLFSIAPQELSFRLSLLLSKFLGDDRNGQRSYFERARDLYVVRSKIAHGDKINKNEETAAIQITEHWTPEAEELARLSLRRIIENKLIDVFNSKARHEALLLDLLFEPDLKAAVAKLGL